jgi:hypothetical protein
MARTPQFAGADWRADARRWIERQLSMRAVEPPFNVTVYHERPWSFVMLASTGSGDFYFKAVRPEFRHEVLITIELAKRWPDLVPAPIASDADRAWMLMPDGGSRLREAASDGEIVGHWRRLLPVYARMQRTLATEVDWMQALGVPDRRPQSLPEQLRAFADEPMIVDSGLPSGLRPAEKRSWLNLLDRLPELCEALTGFGVPASLNHGDLHDGNILKNGRSYRIFDWGDCSLAHPFFSIRTVFVSLENRLNWPEDDPRFGPLGDAYLQGWTGAVGAERLQLAFDAASRLWAAGSLLSWWQALRILDAAEREPYDHVLPSLTRELIGAAGDL